MVTASSSPPPLAQPLAASSPKWLTPGRVAAIAAVLLCLLVLASRLHGAVAQARTHGAMALALVNEAPMATASAAPSAASLPLARAATSVDGILAIGLCEGLACSTLFAQEGAARCEGHFQWPALCVQLPSPSDAEAVLSVAYDVRPVLLSAFLDSAASLALFGGVLWVWRRARGEAPSAEARAPAPGAPRPPAEKDALTGLLNRVAFETALARHNEAEALSTLETDGCLMYFDLDRFKFINDTHGHIAGDQVLKTVSERLRYTLGGGVLIGRLGGDEFAALITDVSSRATIETICRVLIEQVSKPIPIGEVKEWVGLSIGAYMLKRGTLTVGEMLHRADLAMYEAKRAGRGRLIFYDDAMEDAARTRAQVQAEFMHAIAERQFFMVYQPQFDAVDRVRGVEAMVRWRHPVRGLIPPEEFVPVAEHSGQIVPLGKMVVDMVCGELVALRNQGLALPYVSMDVSLRQLADAAMVEDVQAALQRHGLGPADIEFEVAESTAMAGQVSKENATLKQLAAMSFRIAIDDFGSGCSSLGRLVDLKVDKLKIDGMFVRGIGQPHFNPALLELMITLANRLGVKSVAEGVETPEQVRWLRQAGCQMMQGPFFAEPMTHPQLVQWLRMHEDDDGREGGIWAPTRPLEDADAALASRPPEGVTV